MTQKTDLIPQLAQDEFLLSTTTIPWIDTDMNDYEEEIVVTRDIAPGITVLIKRRNNGREYVYYGTISNATSSGFTFNQYQKYMLADLTDFPELARLNYSTEMVAIPEIVGNTPQGFLAFQSGTTFQVYLESDGIYIAATSAYSLSPVYVIRFKETRGIWEETDDKALTYNESEQVETIKAEFQTDDVPQGYNFAEMVNNGSKDIVDVYNETGTIATGITYSTRKFRIGRKVYYRGIITNTTTSPFVMPVNASYPIGSLSNFPEISRLNYSDYQATIGKQGTVNTSMPNGFSFQTSSSLNTAITPTGINLVIGNNGISLAAGGVIIWYGERGIWDSGDVQELRSNPITLNAGQVKTVFSKGRGTRETRFDALSNQITGDIQDYVSTTKTMSLNFRSGSNLAFTSQVEVTYRRYRIGRKYFYRFQMPIPISPDNNARTFEMEIQQLFDLSDFPELANLENNQYAEELIATQYYYDASVGRYFILLNTSNYSPAVYVTNTGISITTPTNQFMNYPPENPGTFTNVNMSCEFSRYIDNVV